MSTPREEKERQVQKQIEEFNDEISDVPVIVPWITDPFLSSIVTDSLFKIYQETKSSELSTVKKQSLPVRRPWYPSTSSLIVKIIKVEQKTSTNAAMYARIIYEV